MDDTCYSQSATKLSTPFASQILGIHESRYILTLLGVVTSACVALDGAAWLWSVSRLNASFQHHLNDLRETGWQVAPGSHRYAGWPARAVVRTGPLSIGAYGYSLQAEALVIEAPLVNPDPLTLRSAGHRLRFATGSDLPIGVDNVTTTVLRDSVVLSGEHLRVASMFEASSFQFELKTNCLTLTASQLRLLESNGALGSAIDEIELKVEPTHPLPTASNLPSAIALWRDTGGSLKLTLSRLSASGMFATGRADLRLDDALRPALDGIVHLSNYSVGLEALASAGLIKAGSATAAKAVLGLFTQASHSEAVAIPIRIGASTVYVANFGLMRLPTLEWPDSAARP